MFNVYKLPLLGAQKMFIIIIIVIVIIINYVHDHETVLMLVAVDGLGILTQSQANMPVFTIIRICSIH